MRKWLLALVLGAIAIIPVAIAATASAQDETVRLTANLSARNETAGGVPGGTGFAAIRITGDRVCWGVRWKNIDETIASHIHVGGAGVDGPIVVPLFLETPSQLFPHGCTTADPALLADIIANPQNYYVNVHTHQAPPGAIRGQLMMP
jgi:hypothetical protein